MSKPQGLVRPEGLGKLIKIINLIGSRTHDLPACSIMPHPLSYRITLPVTDNSLVRMCLL
jgi:hypothetical protein